MDTIVEGFLVHSWVFQGQFRAAGRLVDGRSFAVVDRRLTSSLVIPADEAGRASDLLGQFVLGRRDAQGFDGSPRCLLDLAPAHWDRGLRTLLAAGLHPDQERPRPADDYLAARGLRGGVKIKGKAVPGNRVDLVFAEPILSPADPKVPLKWLSLDIETARDGEVRAVALVTSDGGEVLFRPDFLDEKGLLEAVSSRLRTLDPDVVTGWNVLDFDLAHLADRYQKLGVPFAWGRTDEPVSVKPKSGGRTSAFVPGRQAVDALRVARMSGTRYEDQSLDTVASAVLGTGKTVSLKGEDKLAELDRLYAQEPKAFCDYCQKDAELVLAILDKTGLGELTVRRAALTGVGLDLAWTSIPPFERIYGLELARRGVLPPAKPHHPVSGASGGMVLDPVAGLHENVLVFDFRSLYPSLMRTFGIDPLAHARAEGRPEAEVVRAPNGAAFLRDRGILPGLIDGYFAARMEAQRAGDETASFVYKILMNSFYGVLGSGDCRYGRTELAGAITTWGRKYLEWARDWFEARGMRVLYGDTDSVFVQTTAEGPALARDLNSDLTASIRTEYGLESHLELRAEKRYRRFLIPRMRGPGGHGLSEDSRGRAKGYAGWLEGADGRLTVDIKGMEAVRSDWTPLARRVQVELLERLFRGEGADALEAWRQDLAADLRRGALDAELVYRKVLRRPADEYTASQPPQVKAARMLGWTDRRGRIEYVITREGPRPVAIPGLPPDYEHYLEHQVRPFWETLVDAAGLPLPRTWDRQELLPF
jgi:DNA polymerase-2